MITLTQQEAIDLIEILHLARAELLDAQNDGIVLTSGAIEGIEQSLEMIENKLYNKEEDNDEENYAYEVKDA